MELNSELQYQIVCSNRGTRRKTAEICKIPAKPSGFGQNLVRESVGIDSKILQKVAPQANVHRNGLWFYNKAAPQANFCTKRTLIFNKLRRRRIFTKTDSVFQHYTSFS